MAKATHQPEVTEIKVISEEKIILELSREEAIMISLLTGAVSGDPCNSPRKICEDIYKALRQAGITNAYQLVKFLSNDHITIYFKDNTLSEFTSAIIKNNI